MEKAFLIVVGLIALYFSGRFLVDPAFAKRYVTESPKAYLWRKMFGVEKTMTMTKYFFALIGVALSLTLIVLGLIK